MSADDIERVAQQNCYLIMEYLTESASRYFKSRVNSITLTATQTKQRFGASGQLLITDVYYKTEFGTGKTAVAMKYFNKEENAMLELRNSLELDIKFRTYPEFSTPSVVFASTKDPLMLIYEGVDAMNFDEVDVEGKYHAAGRLLAAIHGNDYRRVRTDTYQGLTRIIGTYLTATGLEKEISNGMAREFKKLENAMSGCNPFSDFHQSNVMLSLNEGTIVKTIIIDPEFMEKGSFDRLEDIGTFFGQQLFHEYRDTGSVNIGMRDVMRFFQAYEDLNLNHHGLSWSKMYPDGCPLAFFIAQWAIMDAIDKSKRHDVTMNHPTIVPQIDFVRFILNSVTFTFPE